MEPLTSAGDDLPAFCVDPRETLAEALQSLQRTGVGSGVVVGDGRRVLGTLTDALIRRAALNGKGMDVTVEEVMAEGGLRVSPETSEEETFELLHAHRVRSVPVVEDDRLVDVRSLSGFPGPGGLPIAVIMAGGRGQRLRPLTDKVPKPLLRVGSKSIVERMILALAATGVRDVYLAVNYKAEVFEQRLGSGEKLGVRLHYIREEQAMGTAGALSLLSVEPTGPVLVLNGDILTTLPLARLFDFHWRHRGAVTLAGVEHLSHIPYGVLRSVEHHLLAIDEKPVRRDLCSAGMYVLDPDVLRFLAPGQPRDIPDLIADVLAEGLPVHVFPILEEWYDIGGTTEFERVLVKFATGEED
ncbi:MAG: sugar phosphate nucleotidyltransferase [Actinomycetota bacterium]|nr:sugar phosphate nucleotidyltransferase [Actinomycetota bacterium]